MTIKDFKRFILTKTKNRPFIFRFDLENSQKVLELLEMQKGFYEETKIQRVKNKNYNPKDEKS